MTERLKFAARICNCERVTGNALSHVRFCATRTNFGELRRLLGDRVRQICEGGGALQYDCRTRHFESLTKRRMSRESLAR